ncbi:MAG: hypothetical protein SGI98_07085 [Verrucomicrobiota bacterium]|nr:hypothetical protein [Verrucomicrobiota bacterium]
MKTAFLIFLGVISFSLYAPAQVTPRVSAYEAMRAAQGYVNPQAKEIILGIKGGKGTPNPVIWEVTFYDPLEKDHKLILEMDGATPKKTSRPLQFFGGAGEKYAIDLNKLKMNSDGAFKMAKEIAEKENNLLIYRADYVLTKIKPENPESNPIWILNVYDAQNHHLGELTISAYTGNVLRTKKLKYQGKKDATFTEKVGKTMNKTGDDMESFFTGSSSSSKKH